MKSAMTLFSLSTPRCGREETLENFNKTLRMHELLTNKLNVERRGLIDYMNHWSPGTRLDVNPENRINIRDLAVNVNYGGKFVLCRIIAGSYQMTSVMTVVEDPTGCVERLCLNNWVDNNQAQSLIFASRSVIPIGNFLVLLNPTLVVGPDGFTMIRQNNPADVQVVNSRHLILFGIRWMGDSTNKMVRVSEPMLPSQKLHRASEPMLPSQRFQQFCLNSDQTMVTSKGHQSSGKNVLCTPKSSASKGKSLRRLEKRLKKLKMEKSRRDSKFLTLLTGAGRDLSDTETLAVVGWCFVIFVWWFFFF